MIKKILSLLIFLIFTLSSFCQIEKDTLIADFYKTYIDAYKNVNKNSSKNLYEILNMSSLSMFYHTYKTYQPALDIIKKRFNISELNAVEKLFEIVAENLRKKDVWKFNENDLNANQGLFKLSNDYTCSCLQLSSYDKNERPDKIVKIFDSCNKVKMDDTLFIHKIVELLNGRDPAMLEDIRTRNFFTFYLYENCDIVFEYFNIGVIGQITDQYTRELAELKMIESENIVKLYNDNKSEELSKLFPGFNKYKKTFDKIKSFSAMNSFRMRPNYLWNMQANKSQVILSISALNDEVIDYLITFTNNGLDSKVESIKKHKLPGKRPKAKDGEIIEEIIELKE